MIQSNVILLVDETHGYISRKMRSKQHLPYVVFPGNFINVADGILTSAVLDGWYGTEPAGLGQTRRK